MPSLSQLAPIGRLARYDLIGRLAVGGMAEIFLARESGPHAAERHLVLKRIHPHVADDEAMVAMFVDEAKLCLNLRHPNICPMYEFGETSGTFFLAMEWVRGVSLRDLMDRVKAPLPTDFVVRIFADIAGALHHAHTCTDAAGNPLSIVHRDVNPENIMIGFDGVPKLLDFGVAKAAIQSKKTEAGRLKGKFAYISPEQYQGQPIDGRSDVFSLGVSLYEALTGRSLYDRASEYETVAAIVLDPAIPSIRDENQWVPEAIDAISRRALAKERDRRYGTADAMQADLLEYSASQGAVLRHADVARTLRQLVPDLVDAQPDLDRRPPTQTGSFSVDSPVQPPDGMKEMLLAAEADRDAELLLRRQGRSGRMLGLISALVILASIAIIGWVVMRPRPVAPADITPEDSVSESSPAP